MKKLKFTLLTVALMVATIASAQVSLGIKGGLNMSNMVGDEIDDNNMKLGFHVGLAGDYEFAPNAALQTGLYFTTKGYKYDTDNTEYTENLMYLQLPIHFAYKVDASPGSRIVFHAGPYLAYGIGGERNLKSGEWLDATWDVDDIFGDESHQYKPFDAGLGLGVGAELGSFLLDLGWDLGLVNISNMDNAKVRNQNAYLSVGYRFN